MTADVYPLNYGQEYWLAFGLTPERTFGKKVSATYRAQGPLDVHRFIEAVDLSIRSVDAARVQVIQVGDEEFRQRDCGRGLEPGMLVMQRVDEALEPERFREYVGNWLAQETAAGWDPFEGRMMKVGLIRHSPEEHAVVLLLSHLAFDGRSVQLMASKIFRLYDALSQGPVGADAAFEETEQFLPTLHHYRTRMQRRATTTSVEFWRSTFASPEFNTALARMQTSGEEKRSRVLRFDVTGDRFASLQREAQSCGVTANQWILWRLQQTLGGSLPIRGGAFAMPNDYRMPRDHHVIGKLNTIIPLAVPSGPDATPRDTQAALLRSIIHGLVDPWQLRPVLQEVKSRTGLDVLRSVTLIFNHLETGVVDPVDSSELKLTPNYYKIPDRAFTSNLLEIEIDTYDDRYAFTCFHDETRVATQVLEQVATDMGARPQGEAFVEGGDATATRRL